MATSEPCLNCTCKKGVLLCFLKVCPSLSYHQHHILAAGGTDNNCQTIREPGQCCPVVRCESPLTTTVITTTVNEWNTPVTTVTTVPTPSSSSPQHSPTSTGSPFGKEDEQQASQSLFYANALGESGGPSTTSSQLSRVTVTAKENAIFFQTSPATSIQDSPRVVTSSPMAGDGIARIGDVLDPASLDGGKIIAFKKISFFIYRLLSSSPQWSWVPGIRDAERVERGLVREKLHCYSQQVALVHCPSIFYLSC